MKRLLLLSFIILFSLEMKSQTDWAEDVSCILYTHCSGCHNPDGIAPFSLMTYNDAFNYRYAIQNAVNTGSMPPWMPADGYQTYSHQRVLEVADITAINDWVNGGAIEGNPALAPTPPDYGTGEAITNPDLTISVDPYTSTAATEDEYRCFVIENPYNTDMFIQGIEVVPGNRNIVHHALVFIDNASDPLNWDTGNGYTCFGSTSSNSSRLISSYAPGQGAEYYPTGTGIKLSPDDYFIIQVHFPKGTAGEIDATKVNFKMTSTPQREVTVDFILNYYTTMINGPIDIAPETIETYNAIFFTPVDVTVYNVFPHMHLIGKSIKAFAVTITGDTIPLVDIPDWDFSWQSTYFFEKPVKLPAFTTIFGEGVYDNTSSNPNNPSNPPQHVSAGENTNDEMLIIGFAYSLYEDGDENVSQGSSTLTNYCDTVNTVVNVFDIEKTIDLVAFPVPTTNYLQIATSGLPIGEEAQITVYDMFGRIVHQEEIRPFSQLVNHKMNISQLQAGTYSLKLESNDQQGWTKFVVIE